MCLVPKKVYTTKSVTMKEVKNGLRGVRDKKAAGK